MKGTSLSIIFLLTASFSFPHSGGLNSEGCHNDRKTGSYHCHGPDRAAETQTPHPDQTRTIVSRIIDGDTVEVIQKGKRERVRLIEIDAPEMSQPGGAASKNQLLQLINDSGIRLQESGRDRYQRILAEIYIDEININKQMVSLGHAWAYTQYQTDPSYSSLERSARRSRIGLWGASDPIAPWDWRRGKRRNRATISSDANCGKKRYCREMTSCAEARHYLNQCGLSGLDGDNDGNPCESICR